MSAGDWLALAQRVLSCEWVDRRGRDGWCETHDDPWPCGRAQEAADVLAEELDAPQRPLERDLSHFRPDRAHGDTPTPERPAERATGGPQ